MALTNRIKAKRTQHNYKKFKQKSQTSGVIFSLAYHPKPFNFSFIATIKRNSAIFFNQSAD